MKLLKNTPLANTRVDQSTTPKLWKKVRNIAGIVALICGAVVTASASVVFPPVIVTTAVLIGAVATTLTGAASMTSDKK